MSARNQVRLTTIVKCQPPQRCPKCRELATRMVIDKIEEVRICFSCACREGWIK